ncbi:MAG: hypothetical protein LBL73_01925 [Synergistaceae bacterium]|jgi:hypothetical protein|nr:hypothetical protein [Synergistaceae bacterium]
MNDPAYFQALGGNGADFGVFLRQPYLIKRFARDGGHHKTVNPIIFDRFSSRDKKLRFRTPVKFTPSYNEAGDLLVIDEPKYSLHVYAEDTDSLRAELGQAFGMMWQVFVVERDRALTAKAERLRSVLKEEIILEGEGVFGSR